MRVTTILLASLLLLVTTAEKATADLVGYAVGGGGQVIVGRSSTAVVYGGVGCLSRIAAGRLGLGAELGYLTPPRVLTGGLGVLSPGGEVYFRHAARVRPFVGGGYSLIFRSRAASTFHAGAGLEAELASGPTVRVDVRTHVHRRDGRVWSARLGVTFR